MANWRYKVKVKHLFTNKEDYESIKKSMADIADVLDGTNFFHGFNTKKFRNIPVGDDVITPLDYANKLIDKMYNYADDHLIWVE